MCRKQKTLQRVSPTEDRLEAENKSEVRSISLRKDYVKNGEEDLLKRILTRENLNNAFMRVKQNGGAAGIDGMNVDEMLTYLREHRESFLKSILDETYRPKPVRRVEILKPDGGTRLLGVPTVVDRMIQQAITQILSPIYEKNFSENSYGFRPKRSAHQAIRQARKYYENGYTRVVDIDLSKYFDTINHEILMNTLRVEIPDLRVLRLIKRYLKSGVMINGVFNRTEDGSPQGGNLSPLLSNIYLTVLDRELERRGHKFVRYADDINIYVKSQRSAERVLTSITKFLETKLKLKVNETKSKAGSPLRLKFLGFALHSAKGGTSGIRIHEKSIKRFKIRIKELTRRNQGISTENLFFKLKRYTTGWLNYYAIADMKSLITNMTEWIRRKIRMYIWKQWKQTKCRFENLQHLGVSPLKAWEWANTRKGYWRVALSWILSTTLTNQHLMKMGYDDILTRYNALHSSY